MSKKFEELLDYLVNEEHEKFNELFHDIVVERSREIYENLISEEDEEDEEDEEMEEAYHEDDEEESMMEIGGDASDDFVSDVEDPDAMSMSNNDDDMDDTGMDDTGMDADSMSDVDMGGDIEDEVADLKDEFADLKMEFEELLSKLDGGDMESDDMESDDMESDDMESDDMESDDMESDDMESDDMESDDMGSDDQSDDDSMYKMESRKITREYKEKVSDGHGADKKGKGEDGGANTKSVVSSAKGRPTTDASASNILRADTDKDHKPGVGGVLKKGGEFVKSGTQNVGGTKAKGYSDKVNAKHSETNVNDKPLVGK
jgi:hypothetical protein